MSNWKSYFFSTELIPDALSCWGSESQLIGALSPTYCHLAEADITTISLREGQVLHHLFHAALFHLLCERRTNTTEHTNVSLEFLHDDDDSLGDMSIMGKVPTWMVLCK